MIRTLSSCLLIACAAAAAQGQIVFTITGTPTSPALDFGTSDPVTFTMTLDDFSSVTPGGYTEVDRMFWDQEEESQPNMWSQVTVTGQSGSYVVPDAADAYNFIELLDNSLYLWSSTNTGDLGLSVGGHAVRDMQVYLIFNDPVFTLQGGAIPDPNLYFSNYIGNYDSSLIEGGDVYIETITGGALHLNVSSLSIAPVPEASTSAALTGVAGLGAVLVLRRRRKA